MQKAQEDVLKEIKEVDNEISYLKPKALLCLNSHLVDSIKEIENGLTETRKFDDVVYGGYKYIKIIKFYEEKINILKKSLDELALSTRTVFDDYRTLRTTEKHINEKSELKAEELVIGFGEIIKLEEKKKMLINYRKRVNYCIYNHNTNANIIEVKFAIKDHVKKLQTMFNILKETLENNKSYYNILYQEFMVIADQYKYIYNDCLSFRKHFVKNCYDKLIELDEPNMKLYEYYFLSLLNNNMIISNKNRKYLTNKSLILSVDSEMLMCPIDLKLVKEIRDNITKEKKSNSIY